MVPPAAEQEWIAALAAGEQDASGRLRALLADGLEHGADVVVLTDESLRTPVEACELDMRLVLARSLGSELGLKNVVFDMGGVLLKWQPLKMARRVCDNDEDAQLLAKAVFGSQMWVWQDAGAVDEATVAWTAKCSVPARLHPQVDQLVYHWHDDREMLEGTDELVRSLKQAGYGIYLLSNVGPSFDVYKKSLPGYDCFDGMLASWREGVVKPDARIFKLLLERFGLTAGECIFVDDAAINVEGARRVGMRGWHFDGNVDALAQALLQG